MLSRFGKCIFFLLTLGMLASAQTVPAGTRITVRTGSQNQFRQCAYRTVISC